MTSPIFMRVRTLTCLSAILFAATAHSHPLQATELLAHYEYECLSNTGCPHSVRTATEANFGISIYPDQTGFRGFTPGETDDVAVPIEGFIAEFFTSGSFAAPEPMEFLALMVGAGGGGPVFDKSDWRDGVQRVGPPVRIDAGYDVPLVNGIDLDGTAILTELRFQLFDLEIFNSDVLAGSTMRSHYRFEFLGTRVPEPSSQLIVGVSSVALIARRRTG